MRFVGITQRVQDNESYIERRDCLDQRWATFLNKIDIIPIPIPNLIENPSYIFKKIKVDGLILTGGNDIFSESDSNKGTPERDILESRLLRYAEDLEIPVIGVCRGFQFINNYFGGDIYEINNHVSTNHNLKTLSDYKNIFPKLVNSYHNNGIRESDLASPLETLAWSPDDFVEAARHRSLPWLGIMWHPERQNVAQREDLDIFSNHFGSI